jgi:hypothetical protein
MRVMVAARSTAARAVAVAVPMPVPVMAADVPCAAASPVVGAVMMAMCVTSARRRGP